MFYTELYCSQFAWKCSGTIGDCTLLAKIWIPDCNVKSMAYLVFTNCTIQWCFCNQNEYVSSTWQAAAGLHSSFIALLIALIKWAGQRATIKIFLPEKTLKFQCWYERLLLFSWPKMGHFCLHFNREKTQKLIEFFIKINPKFCRFCLSIYLI